jgi:hypothetical protein
LRCSPAALLLALSLLLALAGCSRGAGDLPDVGVVLELSPRPPRIGPVTAIVTLKDAAGQPIQNAQVEVEGNMSHAGMVPVLGQAIEISPGRYQAQLEFTMGGDWFILVRASLPDGRPLQRSIPVPGVDVLCGDTPSP